MSWIKWKYKKKKILNFLWDLTGKHEKKMDLIISFSFWTVYFFVVFFFYLFLKEEGLIDIISIFTFGKSGFYG